MNVCLFSGDCEREFCDGHMFPLSLPQVPWSRGCWDTLSDPSLMLHVFPIQSASLMTSTSPCYLAGFTCIPCSARDITWFHTAREKDLSALQHVDSNKAISRQCNGTTFRAFGPVGAFKRDVLAVAILLKTPKISTVNSFMRQDRIQHYAITITAVFCFYDFTNDCWSA